MATIFSKIISGEIPSYKVFEDDKHLAFLDVNPNAVGHTLCIPKIEVNKIFDMNSTDFLALMFFSYKVADALQKAIDCKRIGMSVIGLEVPHAHVHLVPLQTMDDIRFEKKVKMTEEEFKETAKKIGSFL